MRLIVGERRDRGFVELDQPGNVANVGSDAVGQFEDQRPRLEPRRSLVAVADRDDADPLLAQSLHRVLERDWYALDEDDDRRRARRFGTARLIFQQGPAGERKQRAKLAAVVLLISADQRAQRHARPRIPLRPP